METLYNASIKAYISDLKENQVIKFDQPHALKYQIELKNFGCNTVMFDAHTLKLISK